MHDEGKLFFFPGRTVLVNICSAMADIDLQEKANFTRLARLLIDKGTEALRNEFDAIHPPANLPAVLAASQKSLLRLKFRVICKSQWDLLYHPSGKPPDSKTFDVSLLTVLFRNICRLPTTGWDAVPLDTDRSLQANIIRIKTLRNEVYAHVMKTQIDKARFDDLWERLAQILVELNIPQKDVDELKTRPLSLEEDAWVVSLKDWKLRDEECLEVLKNVRTDMKSIKKSINCLKNIKDEDILRELAKHNFGTKIRNKVKNFLPDTREWLLKDVDDWFNENEQESRILLLTAGPGFGKSVFAAKISEKYERKKKLAACHFCDFSDANLRNPKMMLQSLASQMCENVPGFKELLLDQIKRSHEVPTIKEAFRIYLQNPLDKLEAEPSLVVIDGLDESAADGRSEIVSLIEECFSELPNCVKFLITSRPEISIAKLSDIPNINIENDHLKNNLDIEIYLKFCLPKLLERKENNYSDVFKSLVKMCEGSFLFAYYAQSELKKRDDLANITLNEIIEFLPKGIGSVYQRYFQRLEKQLKELQHPSLDVLDFLEILVAAEGPLPLTFVAKALGLAPDCRETKRIINKVNEAISCLLYVADDMVTIFHKSVIDWLLARGYEDHEYVVNIDDGNESLWRICEQRLEEIKRRSLPKHELTHGACYALKYGLRHLVACNKLESFPWLVDVVIVSAILRHVAASTFNLRELWENVLHAGSEGLRQQTVGKNDKLRAKIMWHLFRFDFQSNFPGMLINPLPEDELFYLQAILTHSQSGYFSDDEKSFARSVLSSNISLFVDSTYYENEADVLPLEVWLTTKEISAVDVSKDKTMAAVAMEGGTISLVSLPALLEEWQYETNEHEITTVTFAPDNSFVLFGKLEMVLDVARKTEVPFFTRCTDETFVSCAFSSNGKRLVTSNGSNIIKLWDVARQSTISEFDTGVSLNWCSFDTTGLFIMASNIVDCPPIWKQTSFDDYTLLTDSIRKVEEPRGSSFFVWNALTLQRCDERILPEMKKGSATHNSLCKRCVRAGFLKQPIYKVFRCPEMSELLFWELPCDRRVSTGMYNGVECCFALGERSLTVIENTHFTTMAVWDCFFVDRFMKLLSDYKGVAAIDNDHCLYSNANQLVVLKTPVAIPSVTVYWSSFSPDGSRLATCSSDGYINIWNVKKGKVEQRFKAFRDETSFVCWWSKTLFVFSYLDGNPFLWNYSVGGNSKILFTKGQRSSLVHLLYGFGSTSRVVDFSGGLLCLKCSETDPVKVIDVNRDKPQIIFLPADKPVMDVMVSPDGTCFAGIAKEALCIWKKNSTSTIKFHPFPVEFVPFPVEFHLFLYTVFPQRWSKYPLKYISRFSNDSKVVVFLGRDSCEVDYNFVKCDGIILDLKTGNLREVPFRSGFYSNWFCSSKNRIIIATSLNRIDALDMDSGAQMYPSFQRNFMKRYVEMKLSPDETVLAFQKLNGDMEFLRLSMTQSIFRERENAAKHWQSEMEDWEMTFFNEDDIF